MKRLIELLARTMQGLSRAVLRFPLTVLCLAGATSLICYMIALQPREPGLIIEKLMFTCLLGSFLGIAAQFTWERFEGLAKWRAVVYGLAALLTLGYYLIIAPASSISFEVQIRTAVAVFAMFCAFLWVPSCGGRYNFNTIALTHCKALFTSVLYSGVLAAGCASIIAAIDTLLFRVDSDAYAYTQTVIWVLFATIYYLSLLPRFNSEEAGDRAFAEHMGQYPRVLEILISYIAIPLLTTYTLVLAAYFIKILVTFNWPSGQLGVMVLAYSAAGLTIYVLASELENRFAFWYRRIFPKVLVPVVIMQLISVGIRLQAYGITESRYYVAIFGIFSITCGVVLSFKPVSKNGIIALLAAAFAIFSVIPPADAFTVSRHSQITRLESMLVKQGILAGGKLKPKADVPQNIKVESTSVLMYLENRNYIKYVKWLPADFKTIDKMKTTLGFEPVFASAYNNVFADLDRQKPINIKGYDVMINAEAYTGADGPDLAYGFRVRQTKYQLKIQRTSAEDVRISVKDSTGSEVIGTNVYDYVKSIAGVSNTPKSSLEPDKMTFDVEHQGYKLRIVFQNVNMTFGPNDETSLNFNALVMFAAPEQ